MVELRWLEKPITGFDKYLGKHVPDKVLQYRNILWQQDQMDDATRVWSDWQDVPTVREE